MFIFPSVSSLLATLINILILQFIYHLKSQLDLNVVLASNLLFEVVMYLVIRLFPSSGFFVLFYYVLGGIFINKVYKKHGSVELEKSADILSIIHTVVLYLI